MANDSGVTKSPTEDSTAPWTSGETKPAINPNTQIATMKSASSERYRGESVTKLMSIGRRGGIGPEVIIIYCRFCLRNQSFHFVAGDFGLKEGKDVLFHSCQRANGM